MESTGAWTNRRLRSKRPEGDIDPHLCRVCRTNETLGPKRFGIRKKFETALDPLWEFDVRPFFIPFFDQFSCHFRLVRAMCLNHDIATGQFHALL